MPNLSTNLHDPVYKPIKNIHINNMFLLKKILIMTILIHLIFINEFNWNIKNVTLLSKYKLAKYTFFPWQAWILGNAFYIKIYTSLLSWIQVHETSLLSLHL